MAECPDLKALAARVVPVLPSLVRNGAFLAGACAVAWGAHLAWPAAGWIVGGLELLAGALLAAKGASS